MSGRHKLTNVKTIRSERTIARSRRWWLVGCLFAGIVCLAVFGPSAIRNSESRGVAAPADQEAFDKRVDFTDDAAAFASAFVRAHGGRAALESIISMRLHGSIVTGGEALDFSVIKKRPDRMRASYTAGQTRIVLGHGAGGSWQRVSVAGRIVPAGELSLPGAMAREKEFFGGLLGTCLEAPSRIVSVTDHRWAGRPCWRVELTGRGGAAGEIHYVDPQTLWPLASEIRDPNGGVSRNRYQDYRREGGLPWACRVQTESNDATTVTRIESIRLNSGIPDTIFEPPTKF